MKNEGNIYSFQYIPVVLYVIALHDYKNHVQFMRMRENQSCVIYLIFKI